MEKDIDRIPKSVDTDIVIRIDDFGGKRGLTIREFVKSERYTGFTKAGTRIPADKFEVFRKAINSIDSKDLETPLENTQTQLESKPKKARSPPKKFEVQEDKKDEEAETTEKGTLAEINNEDEL